MPATLTLENMPDETYERLKAAAASSRRRLNREAIVVLETASGPRRLEDSHDVGPIAQAGPALGSI